MPSFTNAAAARAAVVEELINPCGSCIRVEAQAFLLPCNLELCIECIFAIWSAERNDGICPQCRNVFGFWDLQQQQIIQLMEKALVVANAFRARFDNEIRDALLLINQPPIDAGAGNFVLPAQPQPHIQLLDVDGELQDPCVSCLTEAAEFSLNNC